jgi:hypothetical protein
MGMYHCPECGEMVLAGVAHPDYSLLEKPMPSEKAVRDHKRYEAACHAMQSGVAMKMNYSPTETSPKHLRVGVNSAMVDTGALMSLLVKKGIITEEELCEALADKMEEEVKLYEEALPGNVTLV